MKPIDFIHQLWLQILHVKFFFQLTFWNATWAYQQEVHYLSLF